MTAPTGININYVACYGLSVVGNERKKMIKKKLTKESIHLSSSFCSSPATESQELAPASICHIIITYQPLTPELHCFHQHHLGAQEPWATHPLRKVIRLINYSMIIKHHWDKCSELTGCLSLNSWFSLKCTFIRHSKVLLKDSFWHRDKIRGKLAYLTIIES